MWSTASYHRTIDRHSDVPRLAADVYPRVCRVAFDEPGFCLIDLGPAVSSQSLRGLMVALKNSLQDIHRARTGRDLIYLSCARFDQQVTTKFHRDGGPDECMLMLGYEPSEVASSVALADYAKCAFDLGMTPGEFLERHNPMFAAGMDLLTPYITPLTPFDHRHSQILLINNSMAPCGLDRPRWQGVLHTAEIIDPCESKRRVINSTMIASEPLGTPETVTSEQQAHFATTTVVRRSGYDKPFLADDP